MGLRIRVRFRARVRVKVKVRVRVRVRVRVVPLIPIAGFRAPVEVEDFCFCKG